MSTNVPNNQEDQEIDFSKNFKKSRKLFEVIQNFWNVFGFL
jgi:hypothetical protein